MTITQLKYITAVDQLKSFNKAAAQCNVTQSTLSMQIKKLEDSLDTLIFDRAKRPLETTTLGEQIIRQARIAISEIERINNIVKMGQHDLADQITIGIIPTISPYLLPLFLMPFHTKFPHIKIKVEELITEEILFNLFNNQLDVGILVTPLQNPNLYTSPLYYESFLGYVSNEHPIAEKETISAADLNGENFWLLEKGHCFRSQVLNICKDHNLNKSETSIQFESGSLETLRKMVDCHSGFTLLPELATLDFNSDQQAKVKKFKSPSPLREISLVSHQNFYKKSMMDQIRTVIRSTIPCHMLNNSTAKPVVALSPQES